MRCWWCRWVRWAQRRRAGRAEVWQTQQQRCAAWRRCPGACPRPCTQLHSPALPPPAPCQVFVEGSRAAVEAATAPPPPPASASSSEEEEEAEPEKRGRGRPKKKAPKKEKKEEEKPGFDHVVVGVAVAERFPDGHLTCVRGAAACGWHQLWVQLAEAEGMLRGGTGAPAPCPNCVHPPTPPPCSAPLIMHLGCVAHQAAKWQVPPEQWTCTPDAVSAHGAPRWAAEAGRRRWLRAAWHVPALPGPSHPHAAPAALPLPALPSLQAPRRRSLSSGTALRARTAAPCLWTLTSTPWPCACPSRTACSTASGGCARVHHSAGAACEAGTYLAPARSLPPSAGHAPTVPCPAAPAPQGHGVCAQGGRRSVAVVGGARQLLF